VGDAQQTVVHFALDAAVEFFPQELLLLENGADVHFAFVFFGVFEICSDAWVRNGGDLVEGALL